MEDENVLTFSGNDTPEQVREGLGLPPLAPVDPVAAAEAVLAAAQADAAARVAADPVPDPVVVPEPVALAPPERHADGTFKPRIPAAVAAPVVAAPVVAAPVAAGADPRAAELAELRAKVDALTAAQPKPVAPVVVAPPKNPRLEAIAAARATLVRPTQDQFDDFDQYLDARDAYVTATTELNIDEKAERRAEQTAALTEQRRGQQQNTETYIARIAAAKTVYADFDQVVTDEVQISPLLAITCLDPKYTLSADFSYELGKDRAEAARIVALDLAAQRENRAPIEAVEAIGAFKARVAAKVAARKPVVATHAGATQTGPTLAAPARIARTQAPAPPSTTLGATSGALGFDLTTASKEQLETMSQADYNRLREQTTNTRR